MKTTKLLLSILMALFVSLNLSAREQDTKSKTETLKVLGNCDMCKSRIEKAAKTEDGVANASWDSKTRLLTLNYDPSKTNADSVAKKVAAAGYDTDKFKAGDKAYNALPACCRYDRTGKTTPSEHTHTH